MNVGDPFETIWGSRELKINNDKAIRCCLLNIDAQRRGLHLRWGSLVRSVTPSDRVVMRALILSTLICIAWLDGWPLGFAVLDSTPVTRFLHHPVATACILQVTVLLEFNGHAPSPNQPLIPLLHVHRASSGQNVLDICCGSGDIAFLLAETVGPQGRVSKSPVLMYAWNVLHKYLIDLYPAAFHWFVHFSCTLAASSAVMSVRKIKWQRIRLC